MASYRVGTLEDARSATRLLLDFHAAARLPFEASPAWANALYRSCVTDDDRLALIHDSGRGILLGVVAPSLLGPFVQAHEIAWYVDPEFRGRSVGMLGGYEVWAKTKGAQLIGAASLEAFPALDALYERAGYTRLEQHWVKVV